MYAQTRPIRVRVLVLLNISGEELDNEKDNLAWELEGCLSIMWILVSVRRNS
jgi:hypothetical protein